MTVSNPSIAISQSMQLTVVASLLQENKFYDITLEGKSCGFIKKHNQLLSIVIDKALPQIELCGDLSVENCFITSASKLLISTHNNVSNQFIIFADGLILDSPIVSSGTTHFNCINNIDIRALVATHFNTLKGNNIEINARFSGEINQLDANNTLRIVDDISCGMRNTFNGKAIYIHGDLSGHQHSATASESITLYGDTESTGAITFCAPDVNQYGALKTSANLKVKGKYTLHLNGKTDVNLFKYKGGNLKNDGKMSFDEFCLIRADNLENSGTFNFPETTAIYLGNLTVSKSGVMSWHNTQFAADTAREITVKEKVAIAPEAVLELNNARLTMVDAIAEGILRLTNKSQVGGTNLTIHNLLDAAEDTDVQFSKKIETLGQGGISLNSSFLTTYALKVGGEGVFKGTNTSSIDAIYSKINGPVNWDDTTFTTSTLAAFTSKGTVRNSTVKVSKAYNQRSNQHPLFSNTTFLIKLLNIYGELSVDEKSRFFSEIIKLLGKLTLNSSGINTKKLLVEESGELVTNDQSALLIKEMENKGKSTLNFSYFEGHSVTNLGEMTLNNVVLPDKIMNYFSNLKKLIATQSLLNALTVSLGGTYTLTKTLIHGHTVSEDGEGKLDESKIDCEFYNTSTNAKTSTQASQISANNALLNGETTLTEQSLFDVDTYTQADGKFNAQDSQLTIGKQLTTKPQAEFKTRNTNIAAQEASADFEGHTTMVNTTALFKKLNPTGPSEFTNTTLVVDGKATLSHIQRLDQTSLQSNELVVNGQVQLSNNSQVESTVSTVVMPNAQVNVDDTSTFNSKGKLDVWGELALQRNAKSIAAAMTVYERLKLSGEAQAYAADFHLFNGAVAELNDNALIHTKNAKIHGKMAGRSGALVSDNYLEVRYCGSVDTKAIHVKADTAWFSPTAHFGGDDLSVHARVCENNGVYDLKNSLSVNVDWLYEILSKRSAGVSIQQESNRVSMSLGSVANTRNMATAEMVSLNFLSGMHASDSLVRQSGFKVDVGVGTASYNYSDSSVVSFRLGLNVPSVPQTWGALLNPSHLLTGIEVLGTALFPQFAGAFSVGCKALPIVISGAKGLYEFAQHPKQSLNDMCHYVRTIGDKRPVDFLKLGLKIKNLYVAIDNATHSVMECPEEFTRGNFAAMPSQILHPNWLSVAKAVNAVVGASSVQQSVVDFSGGIELLDNSINNNIVGTNAGINLSAQKVGNSRFHWNSGVEMAYNMTLSGQDLHNSGYIGVGETLTENYQNVEWGQVCTVNLNINGTKISNIDDLLAFEGDYKTIHASGAVSVNNPKQDFNITKNIEHEGDVSVRGQSIEFVEQKSDFARSFTVAKGDFDVKNPINAKAGILLKADEGEVNLEKNKYSAEKGRIIVDAKKNVTNKQGELTAAETFIRSREGKVINIGGQMIGNYLEINGDEGIDNLSAEVDVPGGRAGTHKEKIQGSLLGGDGHGHNNNAICLISKHGKFYNRGLAIAKENIVGDLYYGIDSHAETTEVVHYHHHKGWLGAHNKLHIVYETKVDNAVIASQNGNYNFTTHCGDTNFYGTTLSSHTAPHIVQLNEDGKERDINFFDVIGTRRDYTDDSWFGGAIESEVDRYDEISNPSVIITPKGVPIYYKTTGSVNCRGTDIEGGVPVFTAKNWTNTNQELHHWEIRKGRSAKFSIGGVKLFSLADPNDTPRPKLNLSSSTYDKLKALRDTRRGSESDVAAINASLEVLNTTNEITQAARNKAWAKGILEHTGLSKFKDPDLSGGFTHSSSRYSCTTLGAGRVNIDGADLSHITNDVTFDGVDGHVKGNFKGNMRNVKVIGHELDSSYESSSSTVTFSAKLSNPTAINTSASSSYSVQKNQIYRNTHLDIDGEFSDDNLENVLLDGGVLHTKRAVGHAAHVLFNSHNSYQYSKQGSASAGLDGSFSYSQQQSSSSRTEVAGFYMDESDDQFKVGDLQGNGAYASKGEVSTKATIKSSTSSEYSKSSGFSFSGKVSDFTDMNNAQPLPQIAEQPALKIPTFAVGVSGTDYKATVSTAVHGDKGTTVDRTKIQGNVITNSASPREVSRDKSYNYHLDIPLPNRRVMSQMRSNFRWAEERLGLAKKALPHYQVIQIAQPKNPVIIKKKITKAPVKKKIIKRSAVGKKKEVLPTLYLPLDDRAMHESLTLDSYSKKPFFFGNQSKQQKKKGSFHLIKSAEAAERTQSRAERWNTQSENLKIFSENKKYIFVNNSSSQPEEGTSYIRLKGFGETLLGVTKEVAALAFKQTRMHAIVSGVKAGGALDDIASGVMEMVTGREEETNIDSLIDDLGGVQEQPSHRQYASRVMTFDDYLNHGVIVESVLDNTPILSTNVGDTTTSVALPKQSWNIKTRLKGALGAALGITEGVFGAAETLAAMPTVAGSVIGGLIIADGIDRFDAGLVAAVTGKDGKTAYVIIATDLGLDPELAELGKDVLLSSPTAYLAIKHLIKEAYISKFSIESIGLWVKRANATSYMANVNELNFTDTIRMDANGYKVFLDSVEHYGFKEPIEVFEASTGDTYVINGNARLSAAVELNFERIPANKVGLPKGSTEAQLTEIPNTYTGITNKLNP